MARQSWSAGTARQITARVVVEGDLVLQTAAHFGNGDGDDLTDMPLLIDPQEGLPLLTGATIAGALRSYLRTTERGYQVPLPHAGHASDATATKLERESAVVRLFGGFRADDEGEQSPLIVDDALGRDYGIEFRDGVKINLASRTAEEDKLFNLQLWQAGTTFPLRFELLIRQEDKAEELQSALATALSGLSNGGITLGARKRRGYGRVHVERWRVEKYDLTTPAGLLNWLEQGGRQLSHVSPEPYIQQALKVAPLPNDRREEFNLIATFSLDGSLLIRSGGGRDDAGPDMVHLHARQPDGQMQPILSGTSLAGALRARGLKIAQTLGSPKKAADLIDSMFGTEVKGRVTPRASRVFVEEHLLRQVRTDLVQNRVSIDRFTGGARDTALFNEQPAFGDEQSRVTVRVRLLNPDDHAIGLLLLLLKDLWTGDLPLGGETSVGRGRLRGIQAQLSLRLTGQAPASWKILGTGMVAQGAAEQLEGYVTTLNSFLTGSNA